jgi:hypothetical protein
MCISASSGNKMCPRGSGIVELLITVVFFIVIYHDIMHLKKLYRYCRCYPNYYFISRIRHMGVSYFELLHHLLTSRATTSEL